MVARQRVVYEYCMSVERGRVMGGLWGQAEGIYWLIWLHPPPLSCQLAKPDCTCYTERRKPKIHVGRHAMLIVEGGGGVKAK
jgi:hypothetical protein